MASAAAPSKGIMKNGPRAFRYRLKHWRSNSEEEVHEPTKGARDAEPTSPPDGARDGDTPAEADSTAAKPPVVADKSKLRDVEATGPQDGAWDGDMPAEADSTASKPTIRRDKTEPRDVDTTSQPQVATEGEIQAKASSNGSHSAAETDTGEPRDAEVASQPGVAEDKSAQVAATPNASEPAPPPETSEPRDIVAADKTETAKNGEAQAAADPNASKSDAATNEGEPQNELVVTLGHHWTEWAEFRRSFHIRQRFLVHALVGDPIPKQTAKVGDKVIQLDDWSGTLLSDKSIEMKHASRRPPFHRQLPERIQINSSLFLKAINAPNSSEPGGLFYRPYLALVWMTPALLQRISRLKSNAKPPPVVHTDETSNSATTDGLQDTTRELEELECIYDFIKTVIKERIAYLNDESPGPKAVAYSDMLYLFQPGEVVVSKNEKQAYRVLRTKTTGPHHLIPTEEDDTAISLAGLSYHITLVHIGTNGVEVGPVTSEFSPRHFEGEVDVTTLDYYPLRLSMTPGLRQQLLQMGRLFLDLLDVKHMHFTGFTDENQEVDGRVVIDGEAAFSTDGAHQESRPSFKSPTPEPEAKSMRTLGCKMFCCRGARSWSDRPAEAYRNEDFMDKLVSESSPESLRLTIKRHSSREVMQNKDKVSEKELITMSGRVFGFLLDSRRWATLSVWGLSEAYVQEQQMTTTPNAESPIPLGKSFDQLVLPKGHKELVKSLISQHFRDKRADRKHEQTDIVRGKGKGLVLLLHGAPGVGKTTTAEAVAEYFKKPLFHLTCGDLGTSAKDVEEALSRNFKLASKWGCILLLDEAEVFLATRTPNDHVRNGLVAVFLRTLEYYAGILFVTSNRVGDFDEAVISRIHMSLFYPPLTRDSTVQVLKLNIQRARNRFIKQNRKLEVEDSEVASFITWYWMEYPKARWNGRQIRNACQTAIALAEYEARGGHDIIDGAEDEALGADVGKVNLSVKHFEKVAEAYHGFMDYYNDVFGVDLDTRAKELGIRAEVAPQGGGGGSGGGGVAPGGYSSGTNMAQPAPQSTSRWSEWSAGAATTQFSGMRGGSSQMPPEGHQQQPQAYGGRNFSSAPGPQAYGSQSFSGPQAGTSGYAQTVGTGQRDGGVATTQMQSQGVTSAGMFSGYQRQQHQQHQQYQQSQHCQVVSGPPQGGPTMSGDHLSPGQSPGASGASAVGMQGMLAGTPGLSAQVTGMQGGIGGGFGGGMYHERAGPSQPGTPSPAPRGAGNMM